MISAAPVHFDAKDGPGYPSRAPTPLRRWKSRRNAAIAREAAQGLTVREIADVFDLAPSQVCRILQEARGKRGGPRGKAQG